MKFTNPDHMKTFQDYIKYKYLIVLKNPEPPWQLFRGNINFQLVWKQKTTTSHVSLTQIPDLSQKGLPNIPSFLPVGQVSHKYLPIKCNCRRRLYFLHFIVIDVGFRSSLAIETIVHGPLGHSKASKIQLIFFSEIKLILNQNWFKTLL